MNCIDYFSYLLSRREYSSKELEKKGIEKGYDQDEIFPALEKLQEQDFQSDQRFIYGMIKTYTGKYGKFIIKRKCMEKGINGELFEQVWAEEKDEDRQDDLTILQAKVMRKYHITDFGKIDPKTKTKLWNYLKSRGFNPSELLQQWRENEQ